MTHGTSNPVTDDRLRNTRAWAAARVGTLSGAEVIVAACDEALASRSRVETGCDAIVRKYQRAIWFLQDIADMSKKVGSETAAHALAQLGEPRTVEPELRHDSPEIQFADVLKELDRGAPVNTQDAINALQWTRRNQKREIARLHEKRAAETAATPYFDEWYGEIYSKGRLPAVQGIKAILRQAWEAARRANHAADINAHETSHGRTQPGDSVVPVSAQAPTTAPGLTGETTTKPRRECVEHEYVHDSAAGKHFCGHCYTPWSEIEAERAAEKASVGIEKQEPLT